MTNPSQEKTLRDEFAMAASELVKLMPYAEGLSFEIPGVLEVAIRQGHITEAMIAKRIK